MNRNRCRVHACTRVTALRSVSKIGRVRPAETREGGELESWITAIGSLFGYTSRARAENTVGGNADQLLVSTWGVVVTRVSLDRTSCATCSWNID